MILTSLTARSGPTPLPALRDTPPRAIPSRTPRTGDPARSRPARFRLVPFRRFRFRPAPLRALAGVLLLPLALGACTNSKFVIGPLYNRLDDQMRKEFEKLGDFDERQTALFEAAVGTGHVWHRQHELPAYAAVLDEIATSIARPGTTLEDITRWSETIEAHATAARECHPVNFSFELMKSLDDAEIDFIERRFARERKKNRERYFSRTAEERVEYRAKNVRKWAGRIGVKLTAEQNAMLRSAFERQTSLRREYYLLSDRWNAKLFRLAREQDAPDYDARMTEHLDALWTLLEEGHPEEWEANRRLWRGTGERLVGSLTGDQRETLSTWLAKMADTLVAISRDEPSFEVGDDPSVGCLVETTASGEAAPGEDGPAG